jgi:hypothetical protein
MRSSCIQVQRKYISELLQPDYDKARAILDLVDGRTISKYVIDAIIEKEKRDGISGISETKER